jgi:hypothetical protein
VTDQELRGHDSRSSLRLFDKFTDDNATATTWTPDVTRQRLAFTWATNDFRGPFTFAAGGHRGGERVTPWQFRLSPGAAQKVEVFDGTQWTVLGTLTTAIPINTWVPFEVDATPASATVRINNQEFTTTTAAARADTLAGATFTSGDPIAYGTTFFVDDLSIVEG